MIMNFSTFSVLYLTILLSLIIQSIPVPVCHAVTVKAGDRAPCFDGETVGGREFNLKKHLEKNASLLNFGSVFCHDCITRIEAQQDKRPPLTAHF